ncbi:hypothetical protein RRF57_005644 [Xylaria bambusicola]|uniref:Uncharacterized protein n=1 Tax=Xylaria bambusicola TaxID=326684 RepID=A0AAN7UYC1_9PEZI
MSAQSVKRYITPVNKTLDLVNTILLVEATREILRVILLLALARKYDGSIRWSKQAQMPPHEPGTPHGVDALVTPVTLC